MREFLTGLLLALMVATLNPQSTLACENSGTCSGSGGCSYCRINEDVTQWPDSDCGVPSGWCEDVELTYYGNSEQLGGLANLVAPLLHAQGGCWEWCDWGWCQYCFQNG
jgi:hypothetical protein